jgi:hypothetical protein
MAIVIVKITSDVMLATSSMPYGERFSSDFLNAVATVDQLSTAAIAKSMAFVFSFMLDYLCG